MKKLILLVSLIACFFVIQAQTPDVAIATDTITAIVGNPSEIDVDAVDTAVKATVKENVLGTLSLSDYLSAFLFSFAGLFLRHVFKVRKGVKKSATSPATFSWAYWFQNNFMTKMTVILSTVVIIFLCLRFSVDWFSIEVNMGFAFIIGLAFDWFYDFVRKLQTKVPVVNQPDNQG